MKSAHRNPETHAFLFATGIENSYPTIKTKSGAVERVDEMSKACHYRHWREDFRLVCELGLKYLRYGPPYYKVHLGPGKYDWSFVDETFEELRKLEIVPITDLCHFGVPDWIGNFQNPDWPPYFAEYAEAFAARYPWVKLFTPVNEVYITAGFSARLGWWNECLSSDRAFVTALKHLVTANLLAEEAILRQQPQALFIQSESSEQFHAESPDARPRAQSLNEQRYLSLDLCYGHDVSAEMFNFLTDNGLLRNEYQWLMERGTAMRPYCVMGNDYYISNEHLVSPGDAPVKPARDLFGYYVITKQYYERYRLPVMHTETNHRETGRDARDWLRKQWLNLVHLKENGVPIVGFTWYSLTDQVDWDSALRENNGTVNPLGLFDLDRQIRPVGEMYRTLMQQWRDVLAMEDQGLLLENV